MEILIITPIQVNSVSINFFRTATAASNIWDFQIRTDVGGQPGKKSKDSKESDSEESEAEDEVKNMSLRRNLFTAEELKRISEYRASDEDLERFNTILGFYCGTHNFHNFTIRKGFCPASH